MKAGIGMSEVVRVDTGMTIDRAMTAEILSKAREISHEFPICRHSYTRICNEYYSTSIAASEYLYHGLPACCFAPLSKANE